MRTDRTGTLRARAASIPRRSLLKWVAGIGVSIPPLKAAIGHTRSQGVIPSAISSNVIRIQGIYAPDTIPGGVGEPLTKLREVARKWEDRNPGYTVSFEPASVTGAGQDEAQWLKTQLIAGTAPDVFSMNQENAWPDAGKGWYYTFDDFLTKPNPYVAGHPSLWDQYAYPDIAKGHYGPDNKQYAVDFDMIEVAVYYNKTHFKKAGITAPPKTWAEMLEMNRKLQKAGIRRPTIGTASTLADWGVDLIFDQLFRPFAKTFQGGDLDAKQKQSRQYADYLNPKSVCRAIKMGYLGPDNPRLREVMRLLHEWRQYFSADLGPFSGTGGPDIYRMFVTGQGSMLWNSCTLVRNFTLDTLLDFDVGTFYLPPITRESSPFAPEQPQPMSRIGGIGTSIMVSSTPVHNGNLDKVQDFIHFLCTPEHCSQVVGEAIQLIPNIKGASIPKGMEIFQEILKRPYVMLKNTYWGDTQYNNELRSQNLNFMNDGISLDAFMKHLGQSMDAVADRYIAEYGWAEEAKSWTPDRGIRAHPEIGRPGSI